MTYTAKIEQTYAYPKRMRYMPATDTFVEKDYDSLSYLRGFRQPQGWLKESGTPPCEHLDVIVMTEREHSLGDEVRVRVIGVFCRNDGDHKLVAVPVERAEQDLSELPEAERADLLRLYPVEYAGEGWYGRERAEQALREFFARAKRRIFITVQHAESQHHVNGMIGAWGDWELTERGRRQAREIGKWLLWEGCDRGFHMYSSDLKRASQTAREMGSVLGLEPVETQALREVNAGAGNGRPRRWYAENCAPRPARYDPDYKPFPDAESDRMLWERLSAFCRELLAGGEERVLVVSHGTALSLLLPMLMGCGFEDLARARINGVAGAVSKIVIEPDGRAVVHYLNQRVC